MEAMKAKEALEGAKSMIGGNSGIPQLNNLDKLKQQSQNMQQGMQSAFMPRQVNNMYNMRDRLMNQMGSNLGMPNDDYEQMMIERMRQLYGGGFGK